MKADIIISAKRGDGQTRKIEMFSYFPPSHYTVKVDGVKSPAATVTEVMHRLREWLSAPTKRSSK
jgi:hypothetical protein